jgi:hypothetical protein
VETLLVGTRPVLGPVVVVAGGGELTGFAWDMWNKMFKEWFRSWAYTELMATKLWIVAGTGTTSVSSLKITTWQTLYPTSKKKDRIELTNCRVSIMAINKDEKQLGYSHVRSSREKTEGEKNQEERKNNIHVYESSNTPTDVQILDKNSS